MDFSINVYDKNGSITKSVKARDYKIELGPIIALIELIDIIDITDESSTVSVLRAVKTTWNELIGVLSDIFPGMEKEDWKHVRLEELIPTVAGIVKFVVNDAMRIPSEKN